MHKLSVVVIAALCVIGTSSLALADESLKSDMSQMNDDKKAVKAVQKAKSDGMESDMGRKGGKKDPIMQNREKMKAKRHEMMEKMKAHREAAQTNSTAPVPVPAPAITPAP